MFDDEDDSGHAEKASYAAYNEAVKYAYKTLADSITDYFDEKRERYNQEILSVPDNFRPLKDYERAMKIQKLTLRLALRTAEQSGHKVANSKGLPLHTSGMGACSPLIAALPA
jgi:hypothetical protein